MACRVVIAGFMGVMLIGAWNDRYRLACMYISFAIKGDDLKISLTRRTFALIKRSYYVNQKSLGYIMKNISIYFTPL